MVKRQALALLGLLMTAVSVLVFAPAAGAHDADEAYVYLSVSESSLSGRVELAFVDVEQVFGIDLEGRGDVVLERVNESLEELIAYTDQHLQIGAEGRQWQIEFGEASLLFPNNTPDFNYVQLAFEVVVPEASVPRDLEVTFDPFFDEVPDRVGLLLIENDWAAGTFDNESEALVAFDRSNRSRDVDLGDTSNWSNFTASTQLGLDHIRTGPDHIFFILVLLLPSVLVFGATWQPGHGFGSALWRVLKIATMFTIAHSITFTLAGLDILPLPPSRFVESLIALSIAVAALHNLHPIAANREWLIAFAFGLFHGMGFAGLVSGLDVSRSTQLVSLLGRNVGIEFGQAVIILLVFPGLFLLRRTSYYRPFFLAGSIVLATVSSIWTIERVFATDFGINDYVDAAIEWPRVLVLIAAFTAVAAILHQRERAAGRLLAVASQRPDEAELELATI